VTPQPGIVQEPVVEQPAQEFPDVAARSFQVETGGVPGPTGQFPVGQEGVAESPAATGGDRFNLDEDDPEILLTLVCPEGHELPTPRDMIGQEAICPHCGTQFQLRFEDTREYQHQREQERIRREMAFGKKMMNFAIISAVVVVMGILVMVIYVMGM
jgi:hypothetical protein